MVKIIDKSGESGEVGDPALIVYYCKECKKVVKGASKGGKSKYSFDCPECGNQCSYGTAKAIISHFRIKEASDNGQMLLQMQKEKLEAIKAKEQS